MRQRHATASSGRADASSALTTRSTRVIRIFSALRAAAWFSWPPRFCDGRAADMTAKGIAAIAPPRRPAFVHGLQGTFQWSAAVPQRLGKEGLDRQNIVSR